MQTLKKGLIVYIVLLKETHSATANTLTTNQLSMAVQFYDYLNREYIWMPLKTFSFLQTSRQCFSLYAHLHVLKVAGY